MQKSIETGVYKAKGGQISPITIEGGLLIEIKTGITWFYFHVIYDSGLDNT